MNVPNRPLMRAVRPVIGINRILQITPALDTAIYADEDVLFITTEIKAIDESVGPSGGNGTVDAFIRPGGQLIIQSIYVIDEDKENAAFDLWFLKSNVSIGALNAAEALTDANAPNLIWNTSISSYTSLANVSVSKADSVGKILHAGAGTAKLYIAGVSQGTPTYTAADDLIIRIECSAD